MNTDELGFVETPAPLADWLAAEVLLRAPTQGDRILYPGGGRGNLAAAVHRRCSVRELPAPGATFVERDPGRAEALRDRFMGPDAPLNHGVPERSVPSVEWHRPYRNTVGEGEVAADVKVVEADFLRDPPDGPFDYIVMNPPYTAYQQIATADRETYAEQFETATGQFPLYVPFIEQALGLLADNGILTFLAPDSYLTLGVTESLRWRLRAANCTTPMLVPDMAFDEMVQTAVTTVMPGDTDLLGPPTAPQERRFRLTPLAGDLVYQLFERFGTSEGSCCEAIKAYFETVEAASRRVGNISGRDLEGDSPAVGDSPDPETPSEQATLSRW